MLPVHGLYGHISRNNAISLALIGLFVVAVCALWGVVVLWGVVAGLLVGTINWHFTGNRHLFDATLGVIDNPGFVIETLFVPLLAAALTLAVGLVFLRRIIAHLTGARGIERRAEPRLYNLVETLAITAGLPMPRLEIIEDDGLNAYATGLSPQHSTIAVTRGLLRRLDNRELEAVLAHEISHIKNRDTRVMAIAALFGGLISKVSEVLWQRYLVRSASLNDTFQVRGDAEGGRATAEEQYTRIGRMFVFMAVIVAGPLLYLSVDRAVWDEAPMYGLLKPLIVLWLAACVWIGFKDHLLAVFRGELALTSLRPLAVGLGAIAFLTLMPGLSDATRAKLHAYQDQCRGRSATCMLAEATRDIGQLTGTFSSAGGVISSQPRHQPAAAKAQAAANVERPREIWRDIVMPLAIGFAIYLVCLGIERTMPTAEYVRYWEEQKSVMRFDRSAPLKPQTEYLLIFPFWVLNLISGAILVIIYAASALLQAAVTRPREYMADGGALELVKDPQPLIQALIKIERQHDVENVPAAFLATMIAGPTIGWLATHPQVGDRIAALRQFGEFRAPSSAATASAASTTAAPTPTQGIPKRRPRIVQGLGGSTPPRFSP